MNTLLLLFLEFVKAGLFSIGGGLATIPFLSEMERNYPGWFEQYKLSDIIAVAESTPGPIGINAATFAGFSAAGIPGALVATFSLVLPSFIIITIISTFYEKYRQLNIVNAAFSKLHPAVTGLIASAGYSILKLAVCIKELPGLQSVDLRCVIVFVLLLLIMQIKKLSKLHPLVYILVGAIVGLVLQI